MNKIKFLLFFIFIISISINGINKADYKKLTDRDRILLAISYYEVAKKYEKIGKKDLAIGYYKEAIKIEKDVEKYAKGELEIPHKKININWDDIFNTSKKDQTTDQSIILEEKKNLIPVQ